MRVTHRRTHLLAAGIAATALMAFGATPGAQKVTPADAAAKLSGTWKINLEKSDVRGPAGANGGGRSQMRATPQRYEMAAVQGRGGGGRGGGMAGGGGRFMSDADRASQQIAQSLEQIPPTLTIKATADSVTFSDVRGDRTYAIDNKAVKTETNGATLTTKTRWDKDVLKQEFTTNETHISHTWDVDNSGNELTFRMSVNNYSLGDNASAADRKAVYDRQP